MAAVSRAEARAAAAAVPVGVSNPMMQNAGPRHVIIAMTLTAIVLLIAGPKWNENGSVFNPSTYHPVKPAQKKS